MSFFPPPDEAALERSQALTKVIYETITAGGGVMSFADFMQHALYYPALGYYNAADFSLGKTGDFTTAPEISPLFAFCFAKQCQQILAHMPGGSILELGAGSGRFAKDLLQRLQQLKQLPQHYYIYEISPHLRLQQQLLLKVACPEFFSRIVWLESLPQQFAGIVIANEVLDALSVARFMIKNQQAKECCVALDNDQFAWELRSPSEPLQQVIDEIREEQPLADDYTSEVNLNVTAYVRQLCDSLTQGVLLFADYGYGRAEYYHPQRNHGTLTCFYQHQKHADPLILPGLQDITAHVDFTQVISVAADHGCKLAGYTHQTAFLFACGLTEIATEMEKNLTPAEEVNFHHAIKLLTLPTEMGERVKVMGISKNLDLPLVGFSLTDRRRDL